MSFELNIISCGLSFEVSKEFRISMSTTKRKQRNSSSSTSFLKSEGIQSDPE